MAVAIAPSPIGSGSAMTFSETLWLVTGLLFYEKRVSYRRLSVELNLDSDTLENVRQELAVKQLAVDENGEGLAWVGGVESTLVSSTEVRVGERLNPVNSQVSIPNASAVASPSQAAHRKQPSLRMPSAAS